MGLKTLIKNIKYLSRYNLKETNNEIISINHRMNFLKYELKDDLENLYVPNILSKHESIEYILKNNCSLARFGDGEFKIMKGRVAIFQKKNKKLTQRLNEIFESHNEKIAIGIPSTCCHSSLTYAKVKDEFSRKFITTFFGEHIEWIMESLQKDKIYIDTRFTAPDENIEYYNDISRLWKNRDITIICGDRVFKNIKNNIFDCANSVEYQYAPTENAFDKYDEILECAKTISKDRLIIIILGPTATVLAYDLAQLGYQALDLGHIAKSYDAFCSGMEMSQKNISKFFGKD